MTGTFSCSACGHLATKWFGRCPGCGAWSTAGEAPSGPSGGPLAPVRLHAAPPDPARSLTGVDELDRVLGGGLVTGSVVLLAGEPGIGKSTLVLQLLAGLASAGAETLLVSGEESLSQVAGRATRMGIAAGDVSVAASSSLAALLAACRESRSDVVVVDSIQTMVDDELDQPAGSLVQVRETAAALTRHAKATGTTFILVGHVTKEGSVAGPKTLEHVVDVVLALDGDRGGSLRLLRAVKNRFGATDETGVFEMGAAGLVPVDDPSAFLLADRRAGLPGSIVFPGLEGTRPVLVEVQALVDRSAAPQPRRVAIGLDARRLSLLAAVLANSTEVRFGDRDVFVAAAGGLAVREPAADLAVCLSLLSAATRTPLAGDAVAVGEVGLGGEIRRVPAIPRRLSEARRMGFARALVPSGFDESVEGIRLLRVPDVASAFAQARADETVNV